MTALAGVLFDTRTMWYVTRATGIVSLVLLTASVVLGVTEAVRWTSDHWPRFVTAGLHKNISLLATSFIVVHIATAIIDGYAPIGWVDTVLPFRAAYRPLWLGLGAVAFDLLVAVTITSLLRRRIGHRAWRLVHWAAYASWPLALVHGLGTGTDTTVSWLLGLELACMAAVVVAVLWRVLAPGLPLHDGRRVTAATISVILPFMIAGWVLAGPLQPGWARRAGTPASLLAGAASATATPTGDIAAPAQDPMPSFNASLSGTIADSGPDSNGDSTITIDAQLDSGQVGSVHVVLSGRAIDNGGVSLRSGTVTLSNRGSSDSLTGAVTGLQGSTIDALLQSSRGSSMTLELDLQLDGDSVSGTAQGVSQ